MKTPDLVVVGGPSLDTLEVGGETHHIVGGAGFITAVAARLSGAQVGLVARSPWSLEGDVARAFRPGGLHPGGLCPRDGSWPGFRIQYDDAGIATFTAVDGGLEAEMVAADMPARWLDAPWVHLSPLGGSAQTQLAFARGLRERGWAGRLSVGTFMRGIVHERESLLALLALADLLFLNEGEAATLFDGGLPADLTVYETRGPQGVRVHQGGGYTDHPVPTVEVVDPTGAGDSFCGGVVGALAIGRADPVDLGLDLAHRVLGDWGARALLTQLEADVTGSPSFTEPHAPADGLVAVDAARIAAIGERLRSVATASALDFCGFPFPDRDEARVAENLAVATLHQYGFWTADAVGYQGPMYAIADGKRWKGSDFIWQGFTRAVRRDPSVVDPGRMAAEALLFDRICQADDGACPVPDVASHRALQQAWGQALVDRGGFDAILQAANGSPRPARTLLDALAELPGYAEDPLAKKAMLLVIVLANRPERFLRLTDPESIGPVVDYHIMRGMLRTGCVQVRDRSLSERLAARAWVESHEEAAIRSAAFQAVETLCEVSGLGVDAVDGFFFVNGRARCLETERPRCEGCPADGVCGRHEGLFQPIYRTTAY